MVKKLKSESASDDKKLADAVRASAQQIWHAGLGAFSKAQEEGGKVFDKLVKDGAELQKRTQKLAENKVSDVSGTVEKIAGNLSKQAAGSWDKLEHVFEERVSRAVQSLGIPTQRDIKDLHRRVEELHLSMNALAAKKRAVEKTNKKTTKKPSARPAAISPKKSGTKKPVTRSSAK